MLDTNLELKLAQERIRERAEKADIYRQLRQDGQSVEEGDWQAAARPASRLKRPPKRAPQRLNGARP